MSENQKNWRKAFRVSMEKETEIDLIRGAKYVDPNEVIKKFFETQTDRYVAAEKAEEDRKAADEKADAAKMRSKGHMN